MRLNLVHRLILETFAGPCPDRMEAAHLNGNRQDNRPENLKWATKAENESHKLLHNTLVRGSRSNLAKLKEADVIEIRRLRSTEGMSLQKIAERFSIHDEQVRRIVKRENWKQVA
jgi:DNA-binding transcriptional regulator YiaG